MAWCVFIAVILMSVGQDVIHRNKNELSKFSSPIYYIWVKRTSTYKYGYPIRKYVGLPLQERYALKKSFPEIKSLSPEFNMSSILLRDNKQVAVYVAGVFPNFFELSKYQLEKGGRIISPLDIKTTAHVVVLSPSVRQALFDQKETVIGQWVYLHGIPFQVIGTKMRDQFSYHESSVLIPASAFLSIKDNDTSGGVNVQIKGNVPMKRFEVGMRRVLANLKNFSEKDQEAAQIDTLSKNASSFEWLLYGLYGFLIFSSFMVLFIGAINLANLILLKLEESRYEIGLQMAVGASPISLKLTWVSYIFLHLVLGSCIGIATSFSILDAAKLFLHTGSGFMISWIDVFLIEGMLSSTILIVIVLPLFSILQTLPIYLLQEEMQSS